MGVRKVSGAAAKQELGNRFRRRQLSRYRPYPKQAEFHAAGRTYTERMLRAGNQQGKSYSAAHEMAMHLTGEYPDDWAGRVYDVPIVAWTGAVTNEKSKEIIQASLLGTMVADIGHPDMGTGAIPGDAILKTPTRQAGVKDVVDEIHVRHRSGGTSYVSLKTYEQGETKWTGVPVDVIWLDEEPPTEIYSECLARIQTRNGIIMMTFTPMRGMSDVVRRFMEPAEGDPPRSDTNMTIYDAGHYTPEQREKIIADYPSHQRKTRAFGVPMMGEGRVFPVDEDEIKCPIMEFPRHWPRIAACDFGIAHKGAGVWLIWDRDTDTVYVYDCYAKAGETAVYHAAAFKARDRDSDIPVMWPHDGMNRDKGTGRPLWRQYKDAGANMYHMSARYEDDVGGNQSVEAALTDILERMMTGRFKVASHLQEWFREFRNYHRKDGKVVDVDDDLMAATRYAMMMLRKARVKMVIRPPKAVYSESVISG